MPTVTYECNPQWEQFTVTHGTQRYALRIEPSGRISYRKNGKQMRANMVDETGCPTPAERAFARGSGYTWQQARAAYNKQNPNNPAP